MLRGILAGKYEAKNMSRGNVYCIFVIVTAIVSAPHSPVTIKLNLPPTFQTVRNNEGLCSFFLLKKKGNRPSGKLINLDPHLCQHLIACSLGTDH